MKGLSSLRIWVYKCYCNFYRWKLTYIYGMDLGRNVRVSRKAELDFTVNPRGIHIGNNTFVSGGAIIMTHDHARSLIMDTYIGENCVIGANSIILPGIKVGDQVIVGTGSVVTHDVPSHSIVAGNPARIIKSGINVNNNGQIFK